MSSFHSCNPLISIPTPRFFALVAVGSNVLEIVVPLFQYAGDLGDANAFYTYAQLLRTGKAHRHTYTCTCILLLLQGHPLTFSPQGKAVHQMLLEQQKSSLSWQ